MTPTLEQTAIEVRTLADRLSEGRLPTPEALRYATLLGEALYKVHSSGKVHGGVAPESIVLAGAGIDLTPAPEKLEGHAADVSVDIYGFGAVLYEMLTGCKAFSGGADSVLESTGIPAADRLIAGCLAKDPLARPLGIQKVLLELKFVALAARRSEAPAAAPRETADAALRAEMQQLEARLAARAAEHEKSVDERALRAGDALNALASELAALKAGLSAAQQCVDANTARFAALEQSIGIVEVKLAEQINTLEKGNEAQAILIASVRTSMAQTDNLVGRVLEAMETIQESIKTLKEGDALNALTTELAAMKADLSAAQQGVDANSARFAAMERSIGTVEAQLAGEIHALEKANGAQAALIESVRMSMAQTDDLVGRVVEAMETIQDSVLNPAGARS